MKRALINRHPFFFKKFLCFILSLEACLQPHEYPVVNPVPITLTDEVNTLSHKDIRDIFDRHNCVVCHRRSGKLDLRTYPFIRENRQLDPTQATEIEHILHALTDQHSPPLVFKRPLTPEEKDRLLLWQSQGFLKDPPSPLDQSHSI